MLNFRKLSSKAEYLNIYVLVIAIFTISVAEVEAQFKRNVVFEIFSEVWCGPCASLTPMHKAWLNNHPEYIAIYYYSYFVDKGIQKMNTPEDYKARQNYYAVPFYPYARINAVVAPNQAYPGYPTDTNKINAMVDTMAKSTPVSVELDFINNGHSGTVNVNIISDKELSDLKLYTFIIEKEHIYERQANGLTVFNYIMRKALPNGNGQLISLKSGETLSLEFQYSLDKDINTDLYAAAIVQDDVTKYIYQAEKIFRASPVSVEDNYSSSSIIRIHPNPATDYIYFNFSNANSDETKYPVKIFNNLGQCVMTIQPLNEGKRVRIDVSHLPTGLYFLHVGNDTEKFLKW